MSRVAFDRPTWLATALSAWVWAILLHELLGHAATAVLVGGRVQLVSSSFVHSSDLSGWGALVVAAGGLVVNLLVAAGTGWLATRGGRATLFWWTHAIVNLAMGTGYLLFAPVFLLAGIGDTGALARAAEPSWLAALAMVPIGGVIWWWGERQLDAVGVALPKGAARDAWLLGGLFCMICAALGTGNLLFGLTTAGPTLGAQSMWVWSPRPGDEELQRHRGMWLFAGISALLFAALSVPIPLT